MTNKWIHQKINNMKLKKTTCEVKSEVLSKPLFIVKKKNLDLGNQQSLHGFMLNLGDHKKGSHGGACVCIIYLIQETRQVHILKDKLNATEVTG